MISGSMFDDSLNNFIKKDIDGLSKKKKESRQKENKDENIQRITNLIKENYKNQQEIRFYKSIPNRNKMSIGLQTKHLTVKIETL